MLSHYRLAEKIGEGGMGVVWKAIDTSLDRPVAVKVLPDLFAADPERLTRFEREAKLLASLNHPGIATIHGLHQSEGVRFLAMEFLPGIDLAQRLAQGPILLDDALAVGAQVASALEAAHEHGVIHRDLKPANIHLGPDGRIKILDFGLAKAFEPDAGSATGSLSPTLTTPATRAGVIMGTAAYMSPEQAKGKPVDRRADIWAFGCVLYEMIAGRHPFSGDGVPELLAAVIMGPVNLEALPPSVPPAIRRLIRRCLDKDPRKRLRDIGDARIVIEETLAGAAEERGASIAAAPAGRRVPPAIAAAGILLAVIAGATAMRLTIPRPAPQPLRRFEIPAQGPYRSSVQGNLVALAPDGRRVAYVDQGKLFIRALDRLEPKAIATTGVPAFLFWSPDSAWLAYAAAGKIMKVAAEGGESQVVVNQPGELTGGSGGSWGPDGRIVYTRGEEAIYEVPSTGGDIKTIYRSDPNERGDFHQPSYLPDGSGVLFVYHPPGGPPNQISLLSGGKRKDLLKIEGQQVSYPAYSATGHILYRRQPNNPGIWAVPFSLAKKEITGEPFLVVPDGDVPGVSADGTLVHVKGAVGYDSQLVWLDRTGRVTATIGKPQAMWPFPSLSPDGRQVGVAATENDKRDIWLHDVERGTMTRMTTNATMAWAPAWTPSGDQVVYTEGSGSPFQIYLRAADGSGEAKRIGRGWGPSVSADGRYVAYADVDPNTGWDLFYQDLQKEGSPQSLLEANGDQVWPRIAPDGQYFAYMSDETGRNEIYVKRFPSGEGKWQVSADGGEWPVWSRTGDRIYFARDDAILEATFAGRPAVTLGRPRELFTRKPYGMTLMFGWAPGFDVDASGERFVTCQGVGGPPVTSGIVVVESWLREFAAGK